MGGGARRSRLYARRESSADERCPRRKLAAENVVLPATDGVRLEGSLVVTTPNRPVVVLVSGFKSDRTEMLPWARFLHDAGYAVLMLDRRGTGASEGCCIGLGATEDRDVIGAVRFARERLGNVPVGALGISLGAGIVIRAAAREPSIAAAVADSAWTDQDFQLDRLRSVRVGPVDVPLLPYAEAVVDALVGVDVRLTARPVNDVARLRPAQAILLIHSLDDQNATTPPAGEVALFVAAHDPKQEWRTSGGHIGAINAHPEEYRQRVLAFFAKYLH